MLYEMLTIWPGGEYVHFFTEDKKAIAARYNRCRAQDMPMRIRVDGRLLTIREADELCGQAWERMPEYKRPQVIRHKKTGGLPPAKRKPVAEMDSSGAVLRRFCSIEEMAAQLNINRSTARKWVEAGNLRITGCRYVAIGQDGGIKNGEGESNWP